MKYINAAEILPPDLLIEIQKYVDSGLIYIPENDKKQWGMVSGTKDFYIKRNQEIKEKYKSGYSIDKLSELYGLAYNTIKKIIYSN